MNFKIIGIALLSLIYVSCNNSNRQKEDNHSNDPQETHSNEGHDHSDEDGHNHDVDSHEEHDHGDHEGHDHDVDNHEGHDHSDEDEHNHDVDNHDGHDHSDEDGHDHDVDNHEGYDHSDEDGHDHDVDNHEGHDHSDEEGHDHDVDNHEGHDHSDEDGHDDVDNHEGRDHSDEDGHDHDVDNHEGHDHGEAESHEGHDHSSEENSNPDEISFTKEQAKLAGLTTEIISSGVFNQIIKTSGKIQASQGDEVTIVATSNGTVSFANPSIAEGASVRNGEVIVTVSAGNLLNGDPAVKAKIAFETAQKEMQRADKLIQDKIISAKEYEQIKMRYETAKTTYEAQSANVTSKGVKIKSPISGYIKNRFVAQGEYVSVGQAIATISQNKKLQLRAEVSEKNYKKLKNIRTANFKTAYDDALYKLKDLNGRLLSYGRTSGQQSFYIPVTFEFDNIGDIIPGSFSEIYLIAAPMDNVISVPSSSVTEEQGLHFVYVQLGEEVFKKLEVRLGQNNGERVQIHSGLKEGDKVVTEGVYQVKLAATSSVMPEGHGHNH